MIYPSIDKLLNIVSSKYELVHVAARRSKEMSRKENYQLRENEYKCSKNIGRALEEVLDGELKVVESD
ncbi:DNA-directed RNA polymerase subunit omega [bacterium]|nr:DNA-directed RNA polymerase subunit omega [bacterium]